MASQLENINLDFELDEYPSKESISYYKEATKELQNRIDFISTESKGFQELKNIIRSSLLTGKGSFQEILNTNKKIRALFSLWKEEVDFFISFPPNKDILEYMGDLNFNLSRLTVYGVIQLYFDKYDHIKVSVSYSKFIRDQLAVFQENSEASVLKKLSNNMDVLFTAGAPHTIVKNAIYNQLELNVYVSELGININDRGRFLEVCKCIYYIKSVEKLNPGEEANIFKELKNRKIIESSYKNGQLLGHSIIEVMIRKGIKSNSALPENWQKIILSIAGDPRVPSTQKNYRMWWNLIDFNLCNHFKGWLSSYDLGLFLDVFENFTESSNNESLKRMFPARKKFLDGLLENDLIQTTRLYISNDADSYLRRSFDGDQLPSYARLSNADRGKCIIYLNVNGIHVLEGSHNSKFWMYKNLPNNNLLLDYNVIEFDVSDLGARLSDNTVREFGEIMQPTSIVHASSDTCLWQYKALTAFRKYGVIIKPEWVLSKDDYVVYRARYGVR